MKRAMVQCSKLWLKRDEFGRFFPLDLRCNLCAYEIFSHMVLIEGHVFSKHFKCKLGQQARFETGSEKKSWRIYHKRKACMECWNSNAYYNLSWALRLIYLDYRLLFISTKIKHRSPYNVISNSTLSIYNTLKNKSIYYVTDYILALQVLTRSAI